MSEVQTYIERLRELRGSTLKALDGMSASGLNWKPTRREANSLYALATHLLGSERHWLHRNVGQRAVERDRDAEFRARGTNTDALRESFDAVARASEAILAQLAPAELDATRPTPNYGPRTVRWCILHMLEHYAEHLGHMRLTRQLWESQSKSKKRKAKGGKSSVKESRGEREKRKRKSKR